LIRWILKKEKIRNWLWETCRNVQEKPKMTTKIFIGISLIIFSFVIYYGGMIVCGSLAIYLKTPEIAIIGIPALYGLSWLVWLLGMYLLGKVNYIYVKYRLAIYLKNRYSPDTGSGQA